MSVRHLTKHLATLITQKALFTIIISYWLADPDTQSRSSNGWFSHPCLSEFLGTSPPLARLGAKPFFHHHKEPHHCKHYSSSPSDLSIYYHVIEMPSNVELQRAAGCKSGQSAAPLTFNSQ